MSSPEIRVVLISAEPEGHTATEPTRELEAIRAAVSGGQVKVVRESIYHATRATVMAGIDEHKPQLIHWHSHGTRDGVFIEGPDGTSTRVEAKWLTDVIGACEQTRLVVLSACESIHLAEALARSPHTRVLGAIAWTVPIPNTHARAFSAELYRRLARGNGVIAAFEFARRTLETNLQDKVKLVERVKGTEFVLYEPQAAPPPPPPPPPTRHEPPSGSPVLRLRVFVGLLLAGFIALALYTCGTSIAEQLAAAEQKAADERQAAEMKKILDEKRAASAKKPVVKPGSGSGTKKTEPLAPTPDEIIVAKPELSVEAEINPVVGLCPVNQKCPSLTAVRKALDDALKAAVNGCPGEPPEDRTEILMKWKDPKYPTVIVTSVKFPATPTGFVACVRNALEKVTMHPNVASATIKFSVEPM